MNRLLLRLHKLCPMWAWHRDLSWDFRPFRTHWFCRKCTLKRFNGVGRAYRIAAGKEV